MENIWDLEKKRIKSDEGLMLKPYRCTEGHLTVGYGHKVVIGDASGIKSERDPPISKEKAEQLFETEFAYAKNSVVKKYPGYHPRAQAILINMTFQLGEAGVAKFQNMHAAIQRRDYVTAAKEMRNSKWHLQTKNRCERLAADMQSITH